MFARAGVLAVGLMLACAVPASARDLFAAPAATGSGDCSSTANACTLPTAAARPSNGDATIFLAKGEYQSPDKLTVPAGVTVIPGEIGSRPTLAYAQGISLRGGAALSDVTVSLTNASISQDGLAGATLQRVRVVGSYPDQPLVLGTGGLGLIIESSEIVNSAPGGIGVRAATLPPLTDFVKGIEVKIKGSTIVATRSDGQALVVDPSTTDPNQPNRAKISDTILRGADNGYDIHAAPAGSTAVEFYLKNVCFNGLRVRTTDDDRSKLVQNEGQLSQDAKFVDPQAGDYRPASDSPTIDRGTPTTDPVFDLGGEDRRIQGQAPDIGAWEFYAPNPPTITAPVVTAASTDATVTFDVSARGLNTTAQVQLDGTPETLYSTPTRAGNDPTKAQPVTFKFTGLQPHTVYSVTASAKNAAGEVVSDLVLFQTAAAPPVTPGPTPSPSPATPPTVVALTDVPFTDIVGELLHRIPKNATFGKIFVVSISIPAPPPSTGGVNFDVFLAVSGRNTRAVGASAKRVTLGRGHLTLAPGHRGTLRVKPTKALRKLMRRKKKIRAQLIITSTARATHQRVRTVRTITIKRPAKRRKRPSSH